MKKFRRIWDLVPLILLWLMFSAFLWSFVFNLLTDAPPENKIVLFADAPVTDDVGLALALEEVIADPVRMAQARSFSYAMMGSEEIENADLYIVSASQVQTYRDWFAPLPQELLAAGEVLEMEGVPLGVKIYDAASGKGAASQYIVYAYPGREQEDYYLFLGVNSLHLLSHENAADHQAAACALRLLELP